MSSTYAFRRAAWLVEFLLEHEEVQLKEIVAAWRQSGLSDGETVSRYTWAKVMNRISDIFGVDIECQSKGSHDAKYAIRNLRIFKKNVIVRWMMRCLHYKLQILDSAVIHDRILLEDFPSENGNFIPIKNAMYYNVKLSFDYYTYNKEEHKHHIIQPYVIKTYKFRYYVLGRFDSGLFCVFSFDRMRNLVVTEEKFEYDCTFNAEAYFRKYFGVFINDNLDVEDVVVRAYDNAKNYLIDVPLHCSQQLVEQFDDYADFLYTIVPTNDFIGALLQQSDRLEVISPLWLRNEVAKRIKKMLALYSAS